MATQLAPFPVLGAEIYANFSSTQVISTRKQITSGYNRRKSEIALGRNQVSSCANPRRLISSMSQDTVRVPCLIQNYIGMTGTGLMDLYVMGW